MTMTRIGFAALPALICLAWCAALPALSQERAGTILTIYTDNLGIVREVRRFQLHTGGNQLILRDVPSLLDPTSVVFRPLGSAAGKVAIIEQNFDRPISDDLELLFKRLGKVYWNS